ncbi:MAG: GatB/YqeY domain-containing protein, partial [Alphaproteobacteria bacterium]|nr:GatB/YqeY domain-containing protein [Alphaproteobacteria bacterium]
MIKNISLLALATIFSGAMEASTGHDRDPAPRGDMAEAAASVKHMLDKFKPEQLNDEQQKEAIRESIAALKESAKQGFGHLDRKISLVEQLIK